MDLKEDTGYVNMELDGTGIDLDINGAEIRTDLKMVTNLTDGNYGEKSYDLSGTSLRLDNARVSKQEAVAKDHWWGEVKVTKGDLIWTEPMDVDAEMEIKMRDTEPLITLLGNAKKKKSLIDKALTIKDVTGTVGIQTNEKDIVLDPIQVEGDGLQVISRLDLLEESMNGVLYFKLHGIAANFEIKDGKAKFKGLGGKNKVKKKVNLKDSDSAHKPNPHDHKAISKNLQ